MSDLRDHLIDLFARAELATHTLIGSDGYLLTSVHGNREAAGRAADAILADPRLEVVELPEPEVVEEVACNMRYRVERWRNDESSVSLIEGQNPEISLREPQTEGDLRALAAALLAAARKVDPDA